MASMSIPGKKVMEWSPHVSHQFVVAANDLRFYEIGKNAVGSDTGKKEIKLRSVHPEIQQPKCLAWCPEESMPQLLGVGTASGKVVLTDFSKGEHNIMRQFGSKQGRPCLALAWNPVFKNYLACGMDKMKFEFCCLVWDVNYGPQNEKHIKKRGRGTSAESSSAKPMAELALSEGTVAVEWVPSQPSCLAIGTSFKWLRMYDLRGDLNSPRSVVAHAKTVSGVAFDALAPHRLATFSEDGDSIIRLWDVRKLSDALLSIETGSKRLQKIAWSPTRTGVLGSIANDENCVKLWDVGSSESDESQAAYFPDANGKKKKTAHLKARLLHTEDPLSSFSWHPTMENRFMTLSVQGYLEEISMHETISLSWSPHNNTVFSYGKTLMQTFVSEKADVSGTMKQRCLDGYGMNVLRNFELVCSEAAAQQAEEGTAAAQASQRAEDLVFLWWWVNHSNDLYGKEDGEAPGGMTSPYTGLMSLFKEIIPSTMAVPDQPLSFPVYHSRQRHIALATCGWAYDKPTQSVLELKLKKLESEGEHEQAAALALFHLDLRRAIDALNRDTTGTSLSNLRLVAMSLAGYQESGPQLWREMCTSLRGQFEHPYLRAAFGFLSSDSRDYHAVLEEEGVKPTDRVAFACRFLPDDDLQQFLSRMTDSFVANGSLQGILMTGLTKEGIALWQGYLDRTADIQTAALAMSMVVPKHFKNERVEQWIETYRDLLDRWQLYHHRAKYDVARLAGTGTKVPSQVYARCNFCNNSLSHHMIAPNKLRAYGPMSRLRAKVTSCPSCRKPLPRCDLCLLPLACQSSAASFSAGPTSKLQPGPAPFDNWFTWCQSCRHGGHAAHVIEWFEGGGHRTCPVSDCDCACFFIDLLRPSDGEE